MKLNLFVYLLVFLSSLFLVNAQEEMFETLYLVESNESFQIAYGVNDEVIHEGSVFSIDVYFDDKLMIEDSCFEVFENIDGFYGKIICPVEDLGDGNYKIISKMSLDSEIIFSNSYVFSSFEDVFSYYEFKDLGDGTQVLIHVEGDGENKEVLSFIPKEVIELLTLDNVDELIHSDLEFEIVEEDPLIAWNVEKIPTDINYTIKKKVSKEDLQNFGIEIKEGKSSNILTYIVFVLFVLVLFFSFKPAFKKKDKLKK